jgi:adenylate cyclase
VSASLHIKSSTQEYDYSCGPVTTFGREDKNNVVLQDPKVSRNHALLRILGDGKYYLIDLGSANGTFIDCKRIVAPSALNDGDMIKMGDFQLTFSYEAESVDVTNPTAVAQQTVLATGNVVQRVTILVMDIRNFTPLSEQVSPSFLAAVIGGWFRVASDIAQKNGGEVDKYIGDAVMLRWIADVRKKDESVVAALTTAHEMNLATDAISKDFPALPSPLKIGAGVNTGEAALGGMGRDFTVLGDAVNLAFRFEKATKILQRDIVIGPDSYKYLPREIWEKHLVSVSVKGKEKPVTICALTFEDLAARLAFLA